VILGPVWAPDGKHLIYGSVPSGNNGVMWIRADGGGEPQQLTRDDTHIGQVPTSVSPDGRFVLITKPGAAKEQSLTIDATDPDHPKAGATEPLLNESGSIIGSTISPDGRWLAYTFGASGTVQIFVRPFANGRIASAGAWQISAAGAGYPVWSRVSHQLLYTTSEGRIMMVDYTVEGDSFHASKPRLWTDKQIGPISGNIPFGLGRLLDLTPDGRRIIAWEPQEQPKEAKADLHVTMLLNWFDELRRRLPPSEK
jgi:serine/threonine-protein kinase